jgi:hypothetical protein
VSNEQNVQKVELTYNNIVALALTIVIISSIHTCTTNITREIIKSDTKVETVEPCK